MASEGMLGSGVSVGVRVIVGVMVGGRVGVYVVVGCGVAVALSEFNSVQEVINTASRITKKILFIFNLFR